MNRTLLLRAAGKFLTMLLLIGALLFLPAGTLRFWNGWLLLAILFLPMLVVGAVTMLRDPQLLEKRLNSKETEPEQKTVLLFSAAMFLSAFVAAGLNYRFRWIVLPRWAAWTGAAVFLAAYAMYVEVLRENAFLSRTIEIQAEQKVVDTGLYGVVRHPMYSATLFLFLSMGIVLGSPVSFAILLCYIPIIAKRIKNEEQVLSEGLKGYRDYCRRVRWRMIPFLW